NEHEIPENLPEPKPRKTKLYPILQDDPLYIYSDRSMEEIYFGVIDKKIQPISESTEIVQNVSTSASSPSEEIILHLTLEEIFKGTIQEKTVPIEIQNLNGTETTHTVTFNFETKPGIPTGERSLFAAKEDRPVDVLFVIDEKPHQLFTRK